jgi:hypothetical protein
MAYPMRKEREVTTSQIISELVALPGTGGIIPFHDV